MNDHSLMDFSAPSRVAPQYLKATGVAVAVQGKTLLHPLVKLQISLLNSIAPSPGPYPRQTCFHINI